MREHHFTLILTTNPDEKEADMLYGILDDGTLSTIVGVPQISFHREAQSLEQAIRSALDDVRVAGLEIERVDMEPEAVVQPA